MLTNRSTKLAAIVLVSAFTFWNLPTRAALVVGNLDTTFNGDGKVTTHMSLDDRARGVAVQSDGRIVVAGGANFGIGLGNTDFALTRYNNDGSLDVSFGTGGMVRTDFFGLWDTVNAVALQPDGKIIAAGLAADSQLQFAFALARYNSDGSLDATFGVDGKVRTDFTAGTDQAWDIALQGDGRIIVAGGTNTDGVYISHGDFALARYNSDGSLDSSFGAGGTVTTDFFGSGEIAKGVAIQPDGLVVVAGVVYGVGAIAADFGVARYNVDGTLDTRFGIGGKITTDFISSGKDRRSDYAQSLVVQPDGRAIVAGFGADDFEIVRYNADGSLDGSFGVNGKVRTDFGGSLDQANDVVLQANRIVVVGWSYGESGSDTLDFALARYTKDGSLDQSFGSGGKVLTDLFGNGDLAESVAIQPDGRLLVAGYTRQNGSDDFAVARYDAVLPSPDFAIALDPQSVRVARGKKTTVKVNVDRLEGFAGSITVSAPDASTIGIRLSQDSAMIDGSEAKFKLKVKKTAPTGSHDLVFIGVDSAGRQRKATLSLQIE